MNRNRRGNIITGSTEDFISRSLTRARKLDRGEKLPAEITVSFENPKDMISVLTAERVRLISATHGKPVAVKTLATSLRRDARAVKHDVKILERYGLLRSWLEQNPGHGRRKIVEPLAATIKLVATIGATG